MEMSASHIHKLSVYLTTATKYANSNNTIGKHNVCECGLCILQYASCTCFGPLTLQIRLQNLSMLLRALTMCNGYQGR